MKLIMIVVCMTGLSFAGGDIVKPVAPIAPIDKPCDSCGCGA